ncbi:MAG: NAD(P)H-dependent flavin oxidoreductase [Alcanivorax sp.]
MNNKDLISKVALPVIAAPMFLISNPKMVIACCKNGVIGSVPALNQRTSEGFEEWLIEINAALNDGDAPYAVNLIVNPVNTRLQPDLELCIKYKVPIIITSLGINTDVIEAVHSYGGIVLHDIANIRHAKKAAQGGVDGIIAVCAGAGGHAGIMSPFALAGEIREFYDGILVLAGCISHGNDILAARALGADFAYMGTRFINTKESAAVAEYKDMITQAQATDIVYTDAISGIHANFLKPSLEAAGVDLAAMKDGTLEKGDLSVLEDEFKAWKNIWSAGQGVGNIDNVLPIKDLIKTLSDEYQSALEKLTN